MRLLSLMYKIDSDIAFYVQNLHRKTSSSSILVLLLEQVRTLGWAKARLGRRHVTFPNLREGVLSVNSQIVSLKTFLSKRFFGNNSFIKVNSPSNNSCVWFGLLRSIGSFQT